MASLGNILIAILLAATLTGCASQAPYTRLDSSLQGYTRTIDGYPCVPLTRLCEAYGLNCAWDTFTKTATIRSGPNNIVLRPGSRIALINGVEKRLPSEVAMTDGTVFVPVSFARSDIVPTAPAAPRRPVAPAPVETHKPFTIARIALDTGHGGKDPGAIGRARGTKEKDIALSISNKVRSRLEAAGIKVVMVRNSDTFIPLPKRSDIANSSTADIFVSIHINASRSRQTSGFECYYLSTATDDNARAIEAFENSSLKLSDDADAQHSTRLDKTLWDMTLTENRKESAELAGYICSAVSEEGIIRNNGVKTARFHVLKHTHIPAVLVECGYISNRTEEMKLRDKTFQDRMADAIVRGILRYQKRYEDTKGFTNV